MLSRLFLLFVVVPAVELYLLILIGQRIGALETFGVILITGIIGSYLAKSQGLATWNKLQRKLATGQLPGNELLDGAIILVSAAFLITPGVLTDVAGLLGLIPATRALFRKILQPWMAVMVKRHIVSSTAHYQAADLDNASYHTNEDEPGQPDISGKSSTRPRHQM